MKQTRRDSLPAMALLILVTALLAPTTVSAHNPAGIAGGFASGFLHSVGGALGVRGVFLPGVEIGIAASALLLGFM